MGRPKKNPVAEVTVTETETSKVDIVREANDGKYVAGIRGKRDKYNAGVRRSTNLKEGDVPFYAIAKDGQVQSADAMRDEFDSYMLRDKEGKEIRHNELVLMGTPKEVHDEKRVLELRQADSYLKQNIAKARAEGLIDSPRNTNKKYFNMG